MSKLYGITFHDYATKKTHIVEWLTEKWNALHQLEKLAYCFIYEKEGLQKNQIFDKKDHGKPYGYFLYRNPKKYVDKLIVKKKILKDGYLYNSTEYETICCYYLIEFEDKKMDSNEVFKTYPEWKTLINTNLLDEIKKKFKEREPNLNVL